MSMDVVRKAALARQGTFILLLLLIVTLAVGTLLQAPLAVSAVVIPLETLPLLLFVYPVYKGRTISAVWLALLLTLYFCFAVLAAYAPGLPGALALLRVLLIAACFSTALLMTRWQRVLEGW